MRNRTGLLLVTIALQLLSGSPAGAQLRLPPHVETIKPPSVRSYDEFGSQGGSMLGSLLLIDGSFSGEGCTPVVAFGSCPIIALYERAAGAWQLTRTIEIETGGLASSFIVSDALFYVWQTVHGGGGADPFAEVTTFRMNPGSGEWLPDPPIRLRAMESVAIKGDLMLIAIRDELLFYDYSSNGWVETDRLPIYDFYRSDSRLQYSLLQIEGGYAYFRICVYSAQCGTEHKIAIVDLATRSFSDLVDVSIFSAPNSLLFSVVGDRMAVKNQVTNLEMPYEPISLYTKTSGAWQVTHETELTLTSPGLTFEMRFDGTTLMEDFTHFDYDSTATYFVIYREDVSSAWSETGRIFIPGGNEFLMAIKTLAVSGNAVAFHNSTESLPGTVLYIEDYEYYLDLDGDGMPAGWEAEYGFSDSSFDDFTQDSDQDGALDREEYVYITSPVDPDTDSDQMPDTWEVGNGFDPTNAADASEDYDLDGHTNLEEYQARTDPADRNSVPRQSGGSDSNDAGGGGGSFGVWLLLYVVITAIRRARFQCCRTGSPQRLTCSFVNS